MKILITEKQFEYLESQRDLLGYGADHKVYDTRFSKNYEIKSGLENGDLVIKTGEYNTLKKYAEDFANYPEIFPIVYKFGKRLGNKYDYGYMIIEKLNTNKFYAFIDIVFYYCKKLNYSVYVEFMKNGDIHPWVRNELIKDNRDDIIKFMEDYSKLYKTIKKLAKEKKLVVVANDMVPFLDLHIGNFGISKSGKIKCLDF